MFRSPQLIFRLENVAYLGVKLCFALEKLHALLRHRAPSLNQVQSAGGYLRWISRMRPRLRPFVSGLYDSPKTKRFYPEIGKISPSTYLRSANCFRNAHVLSIQDLSCVTGVKSRFIRMLSQCVRAEKGICQSWIRNWYRWDPSYKRRSQGIPLARNKRQNHPFVKRYKSPPVG